MPALLAAERLGRKISSSRSWLWRGVEFDLNPRTRLGLVGPSGSGKTLLLRALVGLDPVDEGRVLVAGQPLEARDLPTRRQTILYLSQRPALFEGSVEANLKMPFEFSIHRGRAYDRARVLRDLAALGRDEDFLRRPASRLSGGEGQIANLVRALQLDPQILLLDEPTASLDADATHRAECLLDCWLRATPDRACIWTSHDPAQIERATDACLDLGQFKP